MTVQISKIESELKSDNSTLNDDLAFLNTPRADQVSQIESQISSKYDERRRTIKEKLAELSETIKGS